MKSASKTATNSPVARLEAFLQRAGLKTLAIGAMQVFNGVPDIAVAFAERFRESMGVVGGIVENLNLQKFARVLDFHRFIDQALQHVALVIERKLNGDARQLLETLRRLACGFAAVLEIGMNRREPVQAVDGKNRKYPKVGISSAQSNHANW